MSGDDMYRGLSFWHDSLPEGSLVPRAPLSGDRDTDVAIVGGGLTGLWTAWYLQEHDPALTIVVLEKEIAGFGASGRNGGWCSALFPRSTASLERTHGRDAALDMRRAMVTTVDEVGRAATQAGIDADYAKGGTIGYARSRVQLAADLGMTLAQVDQQLGVNIGNSQVADHTDRERAWQALTAVDLAGL